MTLAAWGSGPDTVHWRPAGQQGLPHSMQSVTWAVRLASSLHESLTYSKAQFNTKGKNTSLPLEVGEVLSRTCPDTCYVCKYTLCIIQISGSPYTHNHTTYVAITYSQPRLLGDTLHQVYSHRLVLVQATIYNQHLGTPLLTSGWSCGRSEGEAGAVRKRPNRQLMGNSPRALIVLTPLKCNSIFGSTKEFPCISSMACLNNLSQGVIHPVGRETLREGAGQGSPPLPPTA